jgi:RimJ/RimL family protein N-acetyltransferase
VAFVEPVVLAGELVQLPPLTAGDHDELVAAANDGQLWALPYTRVPTPAEMREAIASYLAAQESATMMPFTVCRISSGDIVGMTSFCNVDAANRRVEIGNTYYAKSVQRTGINVESKLLLLTHAFEQLDCIAVELRTHWFNHRSRQAIERLGAKQDGVLRSHQLTRDGLLRDTVVFSIIQSEWLAVRHLLRHRLVNAGSVRD